MPSTPPSKTRRRQGATEKAVRRDLKNFGELPPGHESLAEAALTLAKTLDAGAGLATAAVARELRAVITQIARGVAAVADEEDPAQELLQELAKPL